jgi:fatty acid/phospholipid biosynthesis enzyme
LNTKKHLTIALDAMGGDLGPEMVIPGASLAAVRHPELRFLLVGDRARIEPLLARQAALKSRAEIRHTDVFVTMDAKPSQALRQGRGKSSMWLTIDAVRLGQADVAVSAGNTGALMAMRASSSRLFPASRGLQSPRSGQRSEVRAWCSTSAPPSAPMPPSSWSSR